MDIQKVKKEFEEKFVDPTIWQAGKDNYTYIKEHIDFETIWDWFEEKLKANHLESQVDVKIAEAIQETMKEIEYCHSDMLTKEERKHPRGNGWARVYDKLENIIKDSRFSD